MSFVLAAILAAHIAGGLAAIAAGAASVAARKGGRIHKLAGSGFVVAMLVLGVTASILEPFRQPEPGSPLVGVLVCYFILTSWVAARRRDGEAGWFEFAAAAAALGTGTLMIVAGWTGSAGPTPVGMGPVYAFGGLCLYAGFLDLSVVLRRKLTQAQRLSRHLWRMCFAFFITTGSFFLGQQDILPAAVRGSPILFVLAFAPFAAMLFWLVRLRLGKTVKSLRLSAAALPAAGPA